MEVEIVKARLQSHGIKAFILDQNLTYTVGPTILGGFRLQVKREDLIKAKQILENSLENEE